MEAHSDFLPLGVRPLHHAGSQISSQMAASSSARRYSSSLPTPQKEPDNCHQRRLCPHAENLKENLAALPLALCCGVAGHCCTTRDATVGNQALPDHHHGGISEGKYFFSRVFSFRVGRPPDNKGDEALQKRLIYFKNK